MFHSIHAVARWQRKFGHMALMAGLAVLLLACQPVLLTPESDADETAEQAAEATPTAREEPAQEPVGEPERAAMTDTEQAIAKRAMDDLASELGIDAEQVTLMEMEAVEWPDASLGCPQPDMMYAQVITPGYRILLEANDERFTYHTDDSPDGQIILCENDE